MTKSRLDNTLFTHLIKVMNRALPLEYAIRAAQRASPQEMHELKELDQEIRTTCLSFGVSNEEIEHEKFMEMAWDVMQVGDRLSRLHGRVPDLELRQLLLGRCLPYIQEKFTARVNALRIPATQYFRMCDLVNGNNILNMLVSASRCIRDARDYEAKDEIEVAKFVRHIREPIHLFPGFKYLTKWEIKPSGHVVPLVFGLTIDLNAEFSVIDMKRQLREFQYEYAVRREQQNNVSLDRLAGELINDALWRDFYGDAEDKQITRVDGFLSVLSGLYCWDRYNAYQQDTSVPVSKPTLETAINETLSIYPKGSPAVGNEAIMKNYTKTRKRINAIDFKQCA